MPLTEEKRKAAPTRIKMKNGCMLSEKKALIMTPTITCVDNGSAHLKSTFGNNSAGLISDN